MKYDAIIVGSGPNGLAAAITLAQNNLKVLVVEANENIGGGLRSAELTLPGYIHDICSAIHPLCFASPFFKTLPLAKFGLEWIQPEACLAHPLDDGSSVLLYKSLDDTVSNLDEDGKKYKKIFSYFINKWESISKDILSPLKIPSNPITLSRFVFHAVQSAKYFAEKKFNGIRARSLFMGLAGHSVLQLNKPLTSAVGIVLGILGHYAGWPFPKGGSKMIASSMASYFISLGGDIKTNFYVRNINDLPLANAYLFDTDPKQLAEIAGKKLPSLYIRQLQKYRLGPGIFKVDWALSSPIPFKSRECLRAGTVHIGNTYKEIINSEQLVWENKHPEKPFVLLAQQSLFDSTRAPEDNHTAWAYCHVPNGSTFDMTERIENQIERFAPGFKDCILAKHTMNTKDYQEYNPNLKGGDITGGVQDIQQIFTRPTFRVSPYSTPTENIYICSASTPPGGGVHGMCGYHAAKAALKKIFNH
jgi:phytoene dehydrogenase-like protein